VSLHENFGSGNTDANPDLKPNDMVMTPRHIAKQMIDFYAEWYDLSECVLLDPCRGDGAFYDQYPDYCTKDWCEITEGRDFFDWPYKVDWIITNPPYSIFPQFLEKCFEVADNVALLIPLAKLVSSLKRIKMVMDYGGIESIRIIGASKCGFPFGFPAAAIHMQRKWGNGTTRIEMWENEEE
jgi:hypothetical protein